MQIMVFVDESAEVPIRAVRVPGSWERDDVDRRLSEALPHYVLVGVVTLEDPED